MPLNYSASKSVRVAEAYTLRQHALYKPTPSEIDAYIAANVTDLSEVITYLELLSRFVLIGPDYVDGGTA